MRKVLCTIMCAFAFMMLICSMAAPALATTNSTDAPEWEVGDRWAYGYEADMGTEFSTYMSNVSDMITNGMNSTGNSTLNKLEIDGDFESWMLFEVSESTDDDYVLTMAFATQFSVDGALKVTVSMPAEGEYSVIEILTAPLQSVVVEAEASVEYSMVVTMEVTMDKVTMAVKEMLLEVNIEASAEASAKNIPSRDFNTTTLNTTIEYTDYDMSMEANVNLAMDLTFAPALDLWEFPMVEGENWTVNSNATLTGSLTGTVDANGLPDEYEANIFTDAFVNATGITDFPIVLDEIPKGDDEDGWPFDDGVLEERTEEIDIGLECTDVFAVDDEFWGNITVYEIAVEDSPMVIYYSPDVSLVSYFTMSTDDLEEVLDLDEGSMSSEDYQMEAVDPEVAEDHISEISGQVSDDDDGGIVSFFTEAPYLGIILVIVIIVVIVAAVVLMRKK